METQVRRPLAGLPDLAQERPHIADEQIGCDMPAELLFYAAANPVFPRDGTGDQWFDHGQSSSYTALGRYLGKHALQALKPSWKTCVRKLLPNGPD